MEDKDYMEDYEENPIIEGDIKAVLDELNLKADIYVNRHTYGDGKHKVKIEGDNLKKKIQVNAWTLRDEFKKNLKSELKIN